MKIINKNKGLTSLRDYAAGWNFSLVKAQGSHAVVGADEAYPSLLQGKYATVTLMPADPSSSARFLVSAATAKLRMPPTVLPL